MLNFPNSPTTGQVFNNAWTWDGEKWIETTGGGIAGVTAGQGLAGGGSSGVVTLALQIPVPIAYGGTGGLTATQAQINLGGPFLPLVGGTLSGPGNLTMGPTLSTGLGATTGDVAIELGGQRLGSGAVYLDLHANQGTDFDLRIIRNPGTNGTAQIMQTGTGYLQLAGAGGVLVYQPGINDPLLVQADNGLYARTRYNVAGTRLWSEGVASNGSFMIADETAGGARLIIDTAANTTIYGGLYFPAGPQWNLVNDGNSLIFRTGGSNRLWFDSSANRLNDSGHLTVNGQIDGFSNVLVHNGAFIVYDNYAQFYHGMYLTGAYSGDSGGRCLYVSGSGGGGGSIYAEGTISCGSQGSVFASMQVNGPWGLNGSGNIGGNCNINGHGVVSSGLEVGGTFQVYNTHYEYGGIVCLNDIYPNNNGTCNLGEFSLAFNSACFYTYVEPSDANTKTDIRGVPAGCLDVVRRVEPKVYRIREDLVEDKSEGEHRLNPKSAFTNRDYWGFLAQDVGRVTREAGVQFPGHLVSDKGEALSVVDMMAVLWAAVRELSDKVASLEV